MLPIFLTRHARNRMRRLGWTESDVSDLLQGPQTVTPSIHGRENAWGQREGRWYRVTSIREPAGRIVVITVTERRKGPQEGDTNED